MFDASEDRAGRYGRMLDELAELGMGLARRMHERAMEAEGPEEAERLALAFHRLSRSVRQTIALQARLERDARRDVVEAQRHAQEVRVERVKARRAQVDAQVSRLIWTEAERSETSSLLLELGRALAEESLSDTFLDGPVDVLIERIKADLGLAANDARAEAAGPSAPAGLEASRTSGLPAVPAVPKRRSG
jgi:regulator of protease activity HflC (stomatin/prohibitin superfamily)